MKQPIEVIIPFCRRDILLLEPCLQSLAVMCDASPTTEVKLLCTHKMSPEENAKAAGLCQDAGLAYQIYQRDYVQEYPGVAGWALLGSWEISDGERPFLFCEPDVTFIRRNPLDRLFEAFEESNKPILGALTQENPVGLYMNGVAVYAPDAMCHDYSPLSGEDLTKSESAFDVRCRHKILPAMWATSLIEQLPKTYNWEPPLPQQAVMVHGVKDGSLWKYIAEING